MLDWGARTVLFVVLVGAGGALAWVASAAASGRLKRNALAGIRLPSTMASDHAWLAAHQRAKPATLYAALTAAATGVYALLPRAQDTVAVGVLAGLVVMMALVLYGGYVGHRAAKDVTPGGDPGGDEPDADQG